MKINIGALLSRRAELNPGLEAFVDVHSQRRFTYREFNTQTNRIANALTDIGVKSGDRVAILMMNSAEFAQCFFAAAKIGAVITPLNWRLVAEELIFILKDSGSNTLIFDECFSAVVAELQKKSDATDIEHWIQLDDETAAVTDKLQAHSLLGLQGAGSEAEPEIGGFDDDLLYIMYTSGTTGLPKGVVHTHHTAIWALLTIDASTIQNSGDRYLLSLPMFHVGALTPVVGGVYAGITTIVQRSFDPVTTWQVVEQERVTTGLLVPTMINFMLQAYNAADGKIKVPSSVRNFHCGAAPVPVSMIEACSELGIEIHQLYGLTESCGPGCIVSPEDALSRPGTTGKGFFHTEVRIVNDSREDVAAGVVGELILRGRHIMKEYWNRPDATRDTLIDGWLYTGDAASFDEDGFVYIQDRLKDMIISGGENIYPAEVENVIMAHPDVVEVAVIGQSSEQWGESPLAVVVSSSAGLTADDIRNHCADKLARFKQPYSAEFVDLLPRNPSGKILKRVLREQFPGPAPR